MTFVDRGSLTGDTMYAARGVWRLLLNDVRWPEDFELSGVGLVRSFFARILRFPFVAIFVILVARGARMSFGWPAAAIASTWDLFGAMTYLLVAMVVIRLLKLPGALAFVILKNWGDLVFALAAAILASAIHFVDPDLKAFRVFWFAFVVPIEIYFVWRAARAALGADLSTSVLLVVLHVGVDVAANQLPTVVFSG